MRNHVPIRETVVADYDCDGTPDTLTFTQEPADTGQGGMPCRRIRVKIVTHRGATPAEYVVLDEIWAVERRVSVSVVPGQMPPVFAVGVAGTDEQYWYQWDGRSFRMTSARHPGFE